MSELKSIVLAAVAQDGIAIKLAGVSLEKDESFLKELEDLKNNRMC